MKTDNGTEEFVDETGKQINNDLYVCKVCKKKSNFVKAQKKLWYYRIDGKESDLIEDKDNDVRYISKNKVDYLCNKHYMRLDRREAVKYVEIGLPYFMSKFCIDGGVFSF